MTTVYNKNGVAFDIDNIATDLNGKMDVDGVNATCPTLLSRTANSYGGVCEIYSDGYCKQNGHWSGTLNITFGQEGYININFSQPFKDTSYIAISQCSSSYCIPFRTVKYTTYCTYSFGTYTTDRTLNGFDWVAEGYIR